MTGGMLLLVYSLVRAPIVGWGSIQTIFTLVGSAALIMAFAFNELRGRNPLVPFAILRVKGLVAADLTQLIAFCGFFSMFFYATLYMQEILHYSPLEAGAAYLPITAGFAVAGGIASQLVTRIGTRPVVVAGCLIAAAGIYVRGQSAPARFVPERSAARVPRDGPRRGLGIRLGHRRRQRRRDTDKAGLAAGLLNSSQQVGSALGLASCLPSRSLAPTTWSPPRCSHAAGVGCWIPPGTARRQHH